jgi:hypothetical protein
MKPIDDLSDDDDDEDEQAGLQNEKQKRQLGQFVRHQDFTENSLEDNEEIVKQYEALPFLDQVFLMDHDFSCILR